jgi:hypothetical protein
MSAASALSALALPASAADAPARARAAGPLRLARGAWAADRALVLFGAAMAAVALLALAGTALDERTLRGASVWTKPFKFAVSIAVLAWTTALVESWLDGSFRAASRGLRALRALFLATATFEIAYIALQAALGQASHFNRSDALHAALYNAMGAAALALAATQPWLAVLLARHAAPGLPPALREAGVVGLGLAFALGAAAGVAMGGMAPPATGGVPFLGWSFGTGDLRPAHFVGSHAAQALPLAAAWALACRSTHSVAWVRAAAVAWTALFALAVAAAFAGRLAGSLAG